MLLTIFLAKFQKVVQNNSPISRDMVMEFFVLTWSTRFTIYLTAEDFYAGREIESVKHRTQPMKELYVRLSRK